MKKHISPINVFIALTIFSTWSFINLGSVISFQDNQILGWTIFTIIISLIFIIAHIVFLIIIIKNKKRTSDEFTTKILYKSGYYAFIFVAFLITITFIIIGVLMIINKDANSLSEFLNIKFILGVMAIIQMLGSLIFIVLYTILNKQGDLSI